jgi:hypothetical protein
MYADAEQKQHINRDDGDVDHRRLSYGFCYRPALKLPQSDNWRRFNW